MATFERGSPVTGTAINTGISAGSVFDGDTGDPTAYVGGPGDWPV